MREIPIKVLSLLKDYTEPVSFEIIRRYIACNDMQLQNCLQRLYRKHLIKKIGYKKNYRYFITPEGIEFLYFSENKEQRRRILENLDNYLRIIGGID